MNADAGMSSFPRELTRVQRDMLEIFHTEGASPREIEGRLSRVGTNSLSNRELIMSGNCSFPVRYGERTVNIVLKNGQIQECPDPERQRETPLINLIEKYINPTEVESETATERETEDQRKGGDGGPGPSSAGAPHSDGVDEHYINQSVAEKHYYRNLSIYQYNYKSIVTDQVPLVSEGGALKMLEERFTGLLTAHLTESLEGTFNPIPLESIFDQNALQPHNKQATVRATLQTLKKMGIRATIDDSKIHMLSTRPEWHNNPHAGGPYFTMIENRTKVLTALLDNTIEEMRKNKQSKTPLIRAQAVNEELQEALLTHALEQGYALLLESNTLFVINQETP